MVGTGEAQHRDELVVEAERAAEHLCAGGDRALVSVEQHLLALRGPHLAQLLVGCRTATIDDQHPRRQVLRAAGLDDHLGAQRLIGQELGRLARHG